MSHQGTRILYHLINRRDDALAERTFAPMPDMAEALDAASLPLFTLETYRAVADFDIIGISLQSELNYINVPYLLDLAGIARRSINRREDDPIVLGGGPCTANPEPVADFFDAILIGDGEAALDEILDAVRDGRTAGENRVSILARLAVIRGVYVPTFYDWRGHSADEKPRWEPKTTDAPVPVDVIVAEADDILEAMDILLATAPGGELLREGAVTVMAGLPNAGKSSLFNALLGLERAIVTEEPGTTRDALEAVVELAGYPFRLVDTAGLRDTDDRVERLGVEVARRYLAGADLILLCVEAGRQTGSAEAAFLAEVAGVPVVKITTKADLLDAEEERAGGAGDGWAGQVRVSVATGPPRKDSSICAHIALVSAPGSSSTSSCVTVPTRFAPLRRCRKSRWV